MDFAHDAQPLADFQRDASPFLDHLRRTGGPVVLTVDGCAALVVQSAASYRELIERAERLETIAAVKEGLASIDRGEGRAMHESFHDLEQEIRRTGTDRR